MSAFIMTNAELQIAIDSYFGYYTNSNRIPNEVDDDSPNGLLFASLNKLLEEQARRASATVPTAWEDRHE